MLERWRDVRTLCGVLVVALVGGVAEAKPWLSATGNLDGVKGDEIVTLDTAGALVAGVATLTIQMDQHDAAFDNQAGLQVVALGGKRRGVLVSLPGADDEDPPTRYRVFLYERGTLRQVYDDSLGVYGSTPLVFDKRGHATYDEDDWTACLREQKQRSVAGATVSQQRVTLKLNKAGTKLVEVSRKPSGTVAKCDDLSACPFVYEETDGALELRGEILRDVRGAAAATTQSLALAATTGTSTVTLAEEKLEVTFLDAVAIEVGGVRVEPRECTADPSLAYCVADGVPHVLRFGQSLTLTFDAPEGARSLVATGYYVPTPTRPFR